MLPRAANRRALSPAEQAQAAALLASELPRTQTCTPVPYRAFAPTPPPLPTHHDGPRMYLLPTGSSLAIDTNKLHPRALPSSPMDPIRRTPSPRTPTWATPENKYSADYLATNAAAPLLAHSASEQHLLQLDHEDSDDDQPDASSPRDAHLRGSEGKRWRQERGAAASITRPSPTFTLASTLQCIARRARAHATSLWRWCRRQPYSACKKEYGDMQGGSEREPTCEDILQQSEAFRRILQWRASVRKKHPWTSPLLSGPAIALLSCLLVLYLCAVFFSCIRGSCSLIPWASSRRQDPPPPIPLTIFSLLRDMSLESLAQDRSTYVIQWTALHSWAAIVPPEQIIIFMDTQASCTRIMNEPTLRGIRAFPVPCWHAEHRRPTLDCLFHMAHEHANTEVVAFLNGDILMHSDIHAVLDHVSAWFPKGFLIVSRRTDTVMPREMVDSFSSSAASESISSSRARVQEMFTRSLSEGTLHSEFGIDLFMYPKSLFASLGFPPFLAGVYRWDNWFLSEMILREEIAVVDASRQGLLVHQQPPGKVGHHKGRTGASWNDGLAKGRSGLNYKLGNIQNADYLLDYARGDRTPQLRANDAASIEVLIAKSASPSHWLAVLSVSHFDVDSRALDNFLCWAARTKMHHVIFLAEDAYTLRALRARSLTVLAPDELPERATLDSSLRFSGVALEDAIQFVPGILGFDDGRILAQGGTGVDNFDFVLFRTEFVSLVLKAGVSVVLGGVNSLWVRNPLSYFAKEPLRPAFGWKSYEEEQEALRALEQSAGGEAGADGGSSSASSTAAAPSFDVAGVGNKTWFDTRFQVVRASGAGVWFWQQYRLCEEANGPRLQHQVVAAANEAARRAGLPSPSPASSSLPMDEASPALSKPDPVLDCWNSALKQHKKKILRMELSPSLFPGTDEFFLRRQGVLDGSLPLVILEDRNVSLLEMRPWDGGLLPGAEAEQGEMGAERWKAEYAARVMEIRAMQLKRWEQMRLLAVDTTPQQTESSDSSTVAAAPSPPGPHHPKCLPVTRVVPFSPPIPLETWDSWHKVHANDSEALRGEVGSHDLSSPLSFTFTIRILTFDRARSLARLLASLQQVDWMGDRISLEVSVDSPSSETDESTLHQWRLVHTVCDGFQWNHGPYAVLEQQQNIGLPGQWTWAWNEPNLAGREVLLVLEDDMTLVPSAWKWMKKVIQSYYLNPHQYDPSMFGFTLQSQHTILGESKKFRYGSRKVHELLPPETLYYRYQLLGTWGTIFFPEHWVAFRAWLRARGFLHTKGTTAGGFKPCVPGLLSNEWWAANPRRVWSQWMVRFAAERGWYSLYTNFPNQESLVVNYREGGLNFAVTKGPMNAAVTTLTEQHLALPPLASMPLLDFNFRDHRDNPAALTYLPLLIGLSRAVIPTKVDSPHGTAGSTLVERTQVSNGVWPDDGCYILKQRKAAIANHTRLEEARRAKLAQLDAQRIKQRTLARKDAAARAARRSGVEDLDPLDEQAAREATAALHTDRMAKEAARQRRLAREREAATLLQMDAEEREEAEEEAALREELLKARAKRKKMRQKLDEGTDV